MPVLPEALGGIAEDPEAGVRSRGDEARELPVGGIEVLGLVEGPDVRTIYATFSTRRPDTYLWSRLAISVW